MSVAGIGGKTIGMTMAQRKVKLQAQAKTQQQLVAAANKNADGESEGLTSPLEKVSKGAKGSGSGLDLNA